MADTYTMAKRPNAFGEWVCRCRRDGKRYEPGDYFADSKKDAESFMRRNTPPVPTQEALDAFVAEHFDKLISKAQTEEEGADARQEAYDTVQDAVEKHFGRCFRYVVELSEYSELQGSLQALLKFLGNDAIVLQDPATRDSVDSGEEAVYVFPARR